MFELITMQQNLPFAIAIALVFILAFIEGLGALMGLGLSSLLETALPDVDLNFHGPDLDKIPLTGKALSWIRIGELPILVVLVVLLVTFGLVGLTIQGLLLSTSGWLLPAYIAAPVSFIIALPWVRGIGGVIAKIIPKDETMAVSLETLIGRVATITLGYSRHNYPAEAKVKDSFGKTHYVMVEPDIPSESFKQGDSVLLVKKDGHTFYAIENKNDNILT